MSSPESLLKEFTQSLRGFIKYQQDPNITPLANNVWLVMGKGDLSVYVRKSRRLWKGSLVTCLDLGTIEVRKELRGKGVFRGVLAEMMRQNPWEAVFIENLMDPSLFSHLSSKDNYFTSEIHPTCLFVPREN